MGLYPLPYDQTMKSPFYGYAKNSYSVDHWKFFEEPDRYGIVALVRNEIKSLPYNERVYKYLRKSHSFTEQNLPLDFKNFILFIHKDLLIGAQRKQKNLFIRRAKRPIFFRLSRF